MLLSTLLRSNTRSLTQPLKFCSRMLSSMPTKYKLTYFDARAIAEIARQGKRLNARGFTHKGELISGALRSKCAIESKQLLSVFHRIKFMLFALAGQPYEDIRIKSLAEWEKLKPEMPFEQIPVLEVDGMRIAQSYAICRFLARRFGYAGKTPFEEALVDSITDQIKDYMFEIKPFLVSLLGLKEVDVEALKKDMFLPESAKLFKYMTRFLKDNPSGYLVGDSLTWADLYLAEHVAVYGEWYPEILEGFPEIRSHSQKVRSNPALKKWIETRPKTKF